MSEIWAPFMVNNKVWRRPGADVVLLAGIVFGSLSGVAAFTAWLALPFFGLVPLHHVVIFLAGWPILTAVSALLIASFAGVRGFFFGFLITSIGLTVVTALVVFWMLNQIDYPSR